MKNSANAWRIVVVATLVLLIVLFGIYVWPTRYAYHDMYGGKKYVRIDRFTGEIRWFDPTYNYRLIILILQREMSDVP
jgi:hypothetical protein